MRAVALTLLAAGCSASDPCAGRGGTCIVLTVQGSVGAIDTLAITVDQPTTETRSNAPQTITLPISVGLNLPSSVEGTVNITVGASLRGATVAQGSAQAMVSNHRGAATVTLTASGPADLAQPGDGSPGDLASSGDGSSSMVPSAPTNVVASSGNAQATVTWNPPASTGGSPITSYQVVASPGGASMTTPDGNTTMATFTGLTNGTAYTFTVAATNAVGTGPAATSNTTTPTATPMVPSAPTNVMAIADVDHGAHVSWTASDNRGSPLMGYSISATQLMGTLGTAGPTATSATVTGLTPGSTYTFTVTATNGIGTSGASFPSNTITAATVPGAPTSVSGVANINNGVTVSWTAPANGFSAITKYTVTASPGGATATTPDGTTTSAALTGLTPGTPYTFTVVATNIIGNGPPSSGSTPVTPMSQLAAPTSVKMCNVGGTVNITFNTVTGADSYDVFYSATPPATSGMKVNVAGSPATVPAPTGSSSFAVAALKGALDGVASSDQPIVNDGQVHDTLFASLTGGFVDIYDCYSTMPSGSGPTRGITTAPATVNFRSQIAVDPTNALLFVNSTQLSIWTNADSINASPPPTYTNSSPGIGAIAVDATNHKLYKADSGTPYKIYRYGYTTAADLQASPAPEASFVYTSGGINQLYVNTSNGDLWGARSSNDGVLYSAAYNLASASGPSKDITASYGTGIVGGFNGVAYSPVNSGTLFLSRDNNYATYWITGVDSLASGAHAAAGYLLNGTSATGTSLAVSSSYLISCAAYLGAGGGSYSVLAWDLSSLSGSAVKTVSASHAVAYYNTGIVYIP
jgi:hypothetical protein